MKAETIKSNKLYTSKILVKELGLRKFQDLKVSGRIDWVQDNSFGDKLYKINI